MFGLAAWKSPDIEPRGVRRGYLMHVLPVEGE
jgi:hypothetical protein